LEVGQRRHVSAQCLPGGPAMIGCCRLDYCQYKPLNAAGV
jgi:hypothetical protein